MNPNSVDELVRVAKGKDGGSSSKKPVAHNNTVDDLLNVVGVKKNETSTPAVESSSPTLSVSEETTVASPSPSTGSTQAVITAPAPTPVSALSLGTAAGSAPTGAGAIVADIAASQANTVDIGGMKVDLGGMLPAVLPTEIRTQRAQELKDRITNKQLTGQDAADIAKATGLHPEEVGLAVAEPAKFKKYQEINIKINNAQASIGDMIYLAQEFPKYAEGLMKQAGLEVPKDQTTDFMMTAATGPINAYVQKQINTQRAEQVNKVDAYVKQNLSTLQVNGKPFEPTPDNILDDKYMDAATQSITANQQNELALLERKYPTRYIGAGTGQWIRESPAEYQKETAAIQDKYARLANMLGTARANDYAKRNPTFAPKEIALEYIKYSNPDKYKLIQMSGGSHGIDRDEAAVAINSLYGTGNEGIWAVANQDEKRLDTQFPDKKTNILYHKLGAELYKKDNWLINASPSVAEMDAVVAKWDNPDDRQHYEKFIRPIEAKIIGTDVPMSGLVNKIGEGFTSTATETGKFIGDLTGLRSTRDQAQNALEQPYDTQYQDVGGSPFAVAELKALEAKEKKETLTTGEQARKAELKTFTNVRSTAQEIIDGTGNLTGQVLFQALGTKGLGKALSIGNSANALRVGQALQEVGIGRGLSTAMAANAIAFGSSYDAAARDALTLFPDEDQSWKRKIYSTTVAGLNAATERIFKDEKVLDAFTANVAPNVQRLVTQLSTDGITRAAFKTELKGIVEGGLKFVGNALVENTKETAEELATSIGTSVATAVLAPTKFNEKQAFDDALNTVTTTFVNGGLVAGVAAAGRSRASHAVIPILQQLGENQNFANSVRFEINRQGMAGDLTQDEVNEKIRIVNQAAEISKTSMTPAANLPEKAKGKYFAMLLNEKNLEHQLTTTNDPAVDTERIKDQIFASQQARIGILAGPVSVNENYERVETPAAPSNSPINTVTNENNEENQQPDDQEGQLNADNAQNEGDNQPNDQEGPEGQLTQEPGAAADTNAAPEIVDDFEQQKAAILAITDPEERKVAEIKFVMANLFSNVGEASANKIREYADRIISGQSRESVIQGLPQSFITGIDNLLAAENQPENATQTTGTNQQAQTEGGTQEAGSENSREPAANKNTEALLVESATVVQPAFTETPITPANIRNLKVGDEVFQRDGKKFTIKNINGSRIETNEGLTGSVSFLDIFTRTPVVNETQQAPQAESQAQESNGVVDISGEGEAVVDDNGQAAEQGSGTELAPSILNQETDLLGDRKLSYMGMAQTDFYESEKTKYKAPAFDNVEFVIIQDKRPNGKRFFDIREVKTGSPMPGGDFDTLKKAQQHIANNFGLTEKQIEYNRSEGGTLTADSIDKNRISKIRYALEEKLYQQAIADGRMTAADAVTIIKSAGLEVPADILKLTNNQNTNTNASEIIEPLQNQAVQEQNSGTEYQPANEGGPKPSPINSDQLTESGQVQEEVTPPEPPAAIPDAAAEAAGAERVGVTHAETARIADELGFDAYRKSPQSVPEWEAEATKRIAAGGIPALLRKMEAGNEISPIDQVVIAKYVASLKARIERNLSNEDLRELKRVIELSDIARSQAARVLRAGQDLLPVEDTLPDYLVREMEVNQVDELTELQKAAVAAELQAIRDANQALEDKIAALQEENARIAAGEVISKERKRQRKGRKTAEDFKRERADIKESIRQKLKDARNSPNATIVPYARELFTVAPDVAKLVRNLVEEGVTNLADVVDSIHETLKEDIPEITPRDVRDIIAGEYNPPRKTKNQLAAQLKDLRDEAALQTKLENLLTGEEPATERKKQDRNRQITDLQKRIKDFKQSRDDAAAAQKRIAELEAELQRVQDRLPKPDEPAAPRNKRELTDQEKDLQAQIAAEKEVWANELKKTPEETALQAMKTRTANQIAEIERQIAANDFAPPPAPNPIVLDREGQALRDKLIKLRLDREIRLLKIEYANRSRTAKIKDQIIRYLNVPRTIMASMDFSAPLRQGIVASFANPRVAASAFVEMFKSGFSQTQFDRWFYDLKESPRYDIIKKSKLGVTDPHDPRLSAQEEAYMGNIAEKIPLIGQTLRFSVKGKNVKIPGLNLIGGSERAYVMYLNKMRVDIFNRFANRFEDQGKTYENSPELYDKMAGYVNNITGRGTMNKTIEKASGVLSTLLFSPRLIASRLNLLNPVYYARLPKEVRSVALQDMGDFMLIGFSIMALTALAAKAAADDDDDDGVTVETDPRSTDFGKIRQGDTRWDIWGGFQPYIRFAAQMATGERKSTTDGAISDIEGKGAFGSNRWEEFIKFGRGKLAPVPGTIVNFMAGKNVVGQEVTVKNQLVQNLTPLLFTTMAESLTKDGLKSVLTVGVPSVFGVGVSTYQSINKEKKITVYVNGEKRDSTPEEYDKYNKLKIEKQDSLLRSYQDGGVFIDRYGDITTAESKKKETKDYLELTPEELKKLDGLISRQATAASKKELGYNEGEDDKE